MLVRARRAFNLVELLVVIGVIAMLLALLLPALSNARRQASQVRCQASLREVAHALFLYAHENRGTYPVVRWDLPERIPDTRVFAYYWSDFIAPYVTRARFNQWILTNPDQFYDARVTVVWGCPTWQGIHAALAPSFNIEGISVYESGYTMNIYPTYDTHYPQFGRVPGSEWSIDSPDMGIVGQWHKQTRWTRPAQRALIVESYLWILGFIPTSVPGYIVPQQAERGFGIDSTPGSNTFDRYRHGRYPTPVNGRYPDDRGRVAFNIAFADGHVEMISSVADAYRAVRLRDP